MPNYTVKQGDCISSIAHDHGLLGERIWNHPKNAKLREKRKDSNILHPGDVVFVPENEEKQLSGTTEQRHRFRRKGVPEKLRLRLLQDDQPRAKEPYTLEIDGVLISGTTDNDGRIEYSLSPKTKRGRIWLGEGRDEYLLNLGHMDPIEEITGVQARLNNLGFHCGEVDGILGPKTEGALKAFQRKNNLKESGKPDEATRNQLVKVHGC